MSTSSVDRPEWKSSPKNPHLVDLLTLPTEIRLQIYGALFGNRVAVITNAPETNQFNVTTSEGWAKRLDEMNDIIARADRSSQILRVCSQIHREAFSVLFANTTFYLHKGAHLASLARFVDCTSVRSVIIRMELRETHDYFECDEALGPLSLEGVAFPSLQSLQIKIRLVKAGRFDAFQPAFDTKFMRTEALLSIARIQVSHHQLQFFLERITQAEGEIALRLVSSYTVGHGNVQSLNCGVVFLLSDFVQENLVDVKGHNPALNKKAMFLHHLRQGEIVVEE